MLQLGCFRRALRPDRRCWRPVLFRTPCPKYKFVSKFLVYCNLIIYPCKAAYDIAGQLYSTAPEKTVPNFEGSGKGFRRQIINNFCMHITYRSVDNFEILNLFLFYHNNNYYLDLLYHLAKPSSKIRPRILKN